MRTCGGGRDGLCLDLRSLECREKVWTVSFDTVGFDRGLVERHHPVVGLRTVPASQSHGPDRSAYGVLFEPLPTHLDVPRPSNTVEVRPSWSLDGLDGLYSSRCLCTRLTTTNALHDPRHDHHHPFH
jgi:hypothetical protein